MPHYKAPNDPRPHFLSDEDIDRGGLFFLPIGSIEITDEEADQMRADLQAQAEQQAKGNP